MTDTYFVNGEELREPNNEWILTFLEQAIKHVERATNADNGNDQFDAAHILIEAWKAIGPLGQVPSWESK